MKGFIILKNINKKVTIVNYAIKEHNGVLWNNEGIMEHYTLDTEKLQECYH